MQSFIERHVADPDVQADIARLRAQHAGSADDIASLVSHVHALMDRDSKSTALKSLQGRIWEEGYRAGELRGQVYPDVPPALARWRRQGRAIAIFSSGSVQAQKLLFANTTAGDLTPFIRACFDTTTGPKTDAESYRSIATALERSPPEVLFLSDVSAELDAAQQAGMQTVLCVRSLQNAPPSGPHAVFHSFDEVLP